MFLAIVHLIGWFTNSTLLVFLVSVSVLNVINFMPRLGASISSSASMYCDWLIRTLFH